MPTQDFPILASTDVGTARKADLSYPPGGSVLTQTNVRLVERSYDSGATQFRIRVCVARFYVSLPAGSTVISASLKATVAASGKNDSDSRSLRIDDYAGWSPPVDTGDYQEDELTGTAAIVALSALAEGVNTVALSGLSIPLNGYVPLRLGIDGGEPTGLNDVSFSSLVLTIVYSNSPQPFNLAVDGDGTSGIVIDRTIGHRFSWTTGQAGTRFKLRYKRVTDVSYTTVDSTTADQFWDAPANTFTSGADNNWVWDVQEYDSEGNPSPVSVQKAFTASGHVNAPTVTAPTGEIAEALPAITITSDSHTKERYRIIEGATAIYDSGPLVQTSNSHTLVGTYFLNGKTQLEDGHSYTAAASIYNSDGVRSGEGTSDFNVVFEPPSDPVLTVVANRNYMRLTISNPAGGATVLSNDIQVSTDYDPVSGSGTWEDLKTALDPNASFDWYEWQPGRLYFLRVRAQTGVSYRDSAVINVTPKLSNWIVMHDPLDPAGTIIEFEGWVSATGNESTFSRSWEPAVAVQEFLNQSLPSISREVTSSGAQKAKETYRVQIMMVARNQSELEKVQAADALLRRANSLCLRTKDEPTGVLKIGGVTNLQAPVPIDSMMNRYQLSFDFVVTQ